MKISAVILLILFCSLLGLPSSSWGEDSPLFETDVRPIFQEKCGRCHSEQVRKGSLDLSSLAAIHRGGESGESLIVPELDENWLWTMLDGGGMPPAEEPQLTEKELGVVRHWLEAGAPAQMQVVAEEKQITQHDVIPIMLLRCTACHGSQLQEGGVDLRTAEAMLKGGKNGPVFTAGDSKNSLMVQRIETEACPPSELLLKFFVKRPNSNEVEQLKSWIDAGAPVVDVAPNVASTEPDLLVTEQDRQHWAFQPPRQTGEHHSIDEFIEQKLKQAELTFSEEATRSTLIRRAYLDLIGLPPSLEETGYWQNRTDEGWYAEMIDQLLESPHYGERWGRFWLDVAGYADSEGGTSGDPLRKVAWKYRDYVIRAFNEDKPYDQFLLEQIAGDELLDTDKAKPVTEEMVQNLIATGFLRMGIDQTGSRTMNFVPERLGVVSDAISVVSSGVMGLTMECARCHTHKYDPIPHRDYYRFKAIFQGALDEYDWLSFKTRTLNTATAEQRKQVKAVNPPLLAQIKRLQKQLTVAVNHQLTTTLKAHDPAATEEDCRDLLVALNKADNVRTLRQKTLVEKLQRAEVVPEEAQPEEVLEARRAVIRLEAEIASIENQMEPELTIRALWDRGDPSPTYILRRGEYDKPGTLVGPGVPSVLTDGRTPFVVEPPFPNGTPKTGRRLAYARWLIQPDNPLTARVMVNRLWYHHFGKGIVTSLDNFGVKGATPTHPELLDWLAVEFVNKGWSIKQMHRLMMNSRTYKQSSHITDQHLEIDPGNQLWARMSLRRLDAEALRDSLLFVSGQLDRRAGGRPDSVSVDREGLVSVNATSSGTWRRSVYLQYRRTQLPTLLDTFDYPEMGPNCLMRSTSTVSPQSLMLMNNRHVRELATAFAQRVQKVHEDQESVSSAQMIETAYQLALSRPPEQEEVQLGLQALAELQVAWGGDSQKALESYCHTLLNSAAFLYLD